MRQQTWKSTAGVFALLVVIAAGTHAACAEDAAAQPANRNPATDRLPTDAARMYGFVTQPHPGELRWQQIPWLTDLGEAIQLARAEGRPLVLFVSGDDPLEKC